MSGTATQLQAETAALAGAAAAASVVGGYGGSGYVVLPGAGRDDPFDGRPAAQPGSVTFTISVPETDWYTLRFSYANGGDADVYRNLLVDGEDVPGALLFENRFAEDSWGTTYDRLKLSAGTHTVTLSADLGPETFGPSAEDVPILVDWLRVEEGVSPSDQTSARALLMNNWQDMVGIHESAQIDPEDDELLGPFLSQLRHAANWQQDQIDFSTAWFRDVTGGGEPTTYYGPQFDSELRFDENGIMRVDYGSYLPTGEVPPISIEKSYAMVPGEPLLVARYTLNNQKPVGTGLIEWEMMETLALPPELAQQAVWDEQREAFIVKLDQGGGESPLYMAFGAFREMDAHQADGRPEGVDLRDAVTVDLPLSSNDIDPTNPGDFGGGATAPERFVSGGALTGQDRAEGDGLILSMSEPVELWPTRPVELYFYYTMSETLDGLYDQVEQTLNPVGAAKLASPSYWFNRTREAWSDKLDRAVTVKIPVEGGGSGAGDEDGGASSGASSGADPGDAGGSGASFGSAAGSGFPAVSGGDEDAGPGAGLRAVDDPALAQAYRLSLVSILQAQQPEFGSFVAATNPNYGYKVWPRDSAVTALTLDAAGMFDEAERYWKWMASVEEDGDGPQAELFENGTFYTNYSFWAADDPINFVQPEWDAQGLFLVGVYTHYNQLLEAGLEDRARAFINDELIQNTIVDVAEFVRQGIGEDGFGPADFSIWETFFAKNAFTQVTYASGLNAAALLADEIGRPELADDWAEASNAIREAILRPTTAEQPGLWNAEEGYLVWGITPEGRVIERPNAAADLIWVFGLLDAEDPKAQAQMDTILERLSHNEYGIARYNSDNFYYSSPYSPGGAYESQVEEASWPQMTSYMGLGKEYAGDLDWALNSLKWTVSRYGEGFMPPGEGVDWSTREPLPSTMVEPVTGAWYIVNLLNYTQQFDPRLPSYGAQSEQALVA